MTIVNFAIIEYLVGVGSPISLISRHQLQKPTRHKRMMRSHDTVLLRSEILKPPKGEEFRDSEGTR
ncbi:hypothetical protein QUA13_27640, partial [Microcoleus sp. S28C3]|uniref:hypothetical protein n=1 Tax=Microcoleus sp. S28C3 TaxID=3055414 RepID=UPI002FD1ABE4